MQYLPTQLTAWLDRQTSSAKKVEPIKDPSNADDRTIDSLLSHIDVSTLGRSHVLSVKAESRNPQTAAAVANALAERYLDYQRRDKIESMDRVDKFLMGRVTELREQVRKSDQAVEDYRRAHDLYKSAGSGGGVTSQQLTELNTQLLAAQTAKAEADSRLQGSPGDAQGRPQQRERAGSAALAPHQRAEAAAVRCRAQGRRAAGHLRRAPSLDAQCPLRSREHPGPGQRRDRQDRRRPGPRGAHRRRPLPGPGPELRDAEEADGRGERQGHPARGAGARRHRQPQPARGHAAARQAEHRRRGHPARPTPSWSRRPRRRRRRAIRRRR